MTTFFLSYSRADQEFSLRLATDLRFAGGSVWVDQFDIQPSERWDRAVERAVRETTGLLLILSPQSVASENVLDEVSVAIDAKKQIIPVLYEKCVVPLRLSRVQFIDATLDYAMALERCKAAVLGKPWTGSMVAEGVEAAASPVQSPEELQRDLIVRPDAAAKAPIATAPASPGFDAAFLDQVVKVLTFHIGPLARHIVSREQKGIGSREDLYERLCARVPAERERAELLRKFRAL